MRRGVRALGAVVLVAGALSCTHRAYDPALPTPTPPSALTPTPVPTPTPTPIPAYASLSEAEPALVFAEDRRAFDAPILHAAATSRDVAVRARGALALGRIGDAQAIEPLRALLGDSSAAVREEAALASGILGDERLAAPLVPLLEDADPAVAARAAWALGVLGSGNGEQALAAAVGRATLPERRAALLRGLWRFADPAAAAAAAPFSSDTVPGVRTAALYVLARRPQVSSLGILTAGLSDPDAQTAALCARALGLLGNPDSLEPLGAVLETGATPVRINAMLALAAILEKNAGATLPPERAAKILSFARDSNSNLAVPAVGLLRWLVEDRDAFRRLWTLATAGSERRQQVALQALMGGLGAKSSDLVDGAVASSDPFLRAAAAEALSSLPEADATPRRERLSEDPAVVVRLKVLEGLKTAGEVRANRALVDRMRADPDAGVRAAALDALSLAEDPAAWTVFQEMVLKSYGDREPDVPISAIGAAEKSPDSAEARAVVEAAYRHPATLVSRLARRALVGAFHADPAQFPWRQYTTGKTVADYAVLLEEARRPWVLRVETSRGAFTVRLAGAIAPLTVMNCLALAGKEYFDGAPIHRVVPNFVVQDGDPTGTGNGGPGYEIRDEDSGLPYAAGTVGMALAGPDTGGSQWFVTQAAEPHLDGAYPVFGRVVSGFDVVLRIEQGDRVLRVAAALER
ncbi:MAG TPA: peptidylprolyl isomerase [Thermoanaerobaculia bacterium]|jgi:cyclophilin family peptidyl-prolyl cis-trans isomerase/HEAT repeat protein|nr:peptidylprolyl isomerase [Thermoanaerobaculia bacterium]